MFVSNQANRIATIIKKRYHEEPDFPFSDPKIQNYGVFRYHINKKWYGLIMNVSKSKFLPNSKNEFVDVINVRTPNGNPRLFNCRDENEPWLLE